MESTVEIFSSDYKEDLGDINRVKWFLTKFRKIQTKIITESLQINDSNANFNLLFVLTASPDDLDELFKSNRICIFFDRTFINLKKYINVRLLQNVNSGLEFHNQFKKIEQNDYRKNNFWINEDIPEKVFCSVNRKPVIWGDGKNYFCGIEDFFGSIRGGFFENGRIGLFLPLIEEILNFSNNPIYGLKMIKVPISIRIDDVPTTWQLNVRKKKIMNLQDYKDIIDCGRKNSMKFSFMVTSSLLSDDLKMKSWNQVGGEYWKIIELLREETKNGHCEIGLHGLSHSSKSLKKHHLRLYKILTKFDRKIRHLAKEYYDCYKGKPIPFDEQLENLSLAKQILDNIIDWNIFCPPSHVWDNNTEAAMAKLGIKFLSADNNSMKIRNDFNSKNPSLLGLKSTVNPSIQYLSGTLYGNLNSLKNSLKYFFQLGIPLVWVKHTSVNDWITREHLDQISNWLKNYNYFGCTLIELHHFLKEFEENSTLKVIRSPSGKVKELDVYSNLKVEPIIYGCNQVLIKEIKYNFNGLN